MRIVVDTNRLESNELRTFLELDANNRAVLPDYVSMELFKPASLDAVYASLSVLSEFPAQVAILKGTRFVALTDARPPAFGNRIIDKDMTKEFPRFVEMIGEAQRGHKGYQRQIIDRRGWAKSHLDSIMEGFGDMSDTISEIRLLFTQEDLRRYANREYMSDRMRLIIFSIVNNLAYRLAELHPKKPKLPRRPFLFDHFLWRIALCTFVGLMEIIGKGAQRRAPEKARNDQVDAMLASYGTYFNGLMTRDKGSMLTHHNARTVLKSLGARLSTDYLEGYDLIVADEHDRNLKSAAAAQR